SQNRKTTPKGPARRTSRALSLKTCRSPTRRTISGPSRRNGRGRTGFLSNEPSSLPFLPRLLLFAFPRPVPVRTLTLRAHPRLLRLVAREPLVPAPETPVAPELHLPHAWKCIP